MRIAIKPMALSLVGGLTGCVATPQPPPAPLVALPGPGKTEAQFRADDASCRADATRAPTAAPTQPSAAQANASQSSATQSNAVQSGQGQAPASPPVATVVPPGVAYLQCMAAQQNIVEPLAPVPPVVYGYYTAYPVYAGVGFGYPFFYNYGRFYGGYGFGGYRHYGYRHFGFHGGGFHHGGFGRGGFGGRH